MNTDPIIVKNVDPVIVNEDGSIKGIVEFSNEPLPISIFMEKALTYYETNPIFQRGDVWFPDMKANLIRSIFLGLPIGPVTLCESKNNVAYKNIIDAKQRCLAMFSWWQGKFKIPIEISGEIKYLSWNDIKLSNEPLLANMRQKFEEYKIQEIVFKNMSLPQQAKQFRIINTFIAPSNEELLYGSNYWVKGLYRYVFNNCFGKIIRHISTKQEKNNDREKGTIFAQRICYICFGGNFEDVWAIRDLGNSLAGEKPMVKDTKKLNDELEQILDKKPDTTIDENFIKELCFYNKIENLKKTCNILSEVLESRNSARKRLKKNDIFDCIIFTMKKIEDGIITNSMIRDDKNQYLCLLTEYIGKKGEAKDSLTGQSVTPRKLKERQELFEKTFNEKIQDKGVKNLPISELDISLALLKSEECCPITKEKINDDNVRVDRH